MHSVEHFFHVFKYGRRRYVKSFVYNFLYLPIFFSAHSRVRSAMVFSIYCHDTSYYYVFLITPFPLFFPHVPSVFPHLFVPHLFVPYPFVFVVLFTFLCLFM